MSTCLGFVNALFPEMGARLFWEVFYMFLDVHSYVRNHVQIAEYVVTQFHDRGPPVPRPSGGVYLQLVLENIHKSTSSPFTNLTVPKIFEALIFCTFLVWWYLWSSQKPQDWAAVPFWKSNMSTRSAVLQVPWSAVWKRRPCSSF